MSPALRKLTFLCLFILLSACAKKPDEDPKKKENDSAPKLVGRVASIPADRKFVLIQAYGKWLVETGAVLTTQGPGERAANLRATGEKLGQYAAADIQSGTLEVGDGVYTIAVLPKKPLTTPVPIEEKTDRPVEEPEADPEEGTILDE